MPTKPVIKTLAASPMAILNAIRNEAPYDYQSRVPEATQDNLDKVATGVLSYEATKNHFLSALVNRIARVIVTSKMYENPLRPFKKGMLEYGETIEEVFVNIAKAHQFDPSVAEKEVFKREIPDVNAVFHKMNLQNFYKVTISEMELRQAFLSYQGISDLIARIVDSLYTAAEYDEYVIMKQLIANAANEGRMFPVYLEYEPSAATAKSVVSTIKGVSNAMEFMNSKYNSYGVLTHTKKDRQVLLINAEFDALIDVEVLASAFNMSKAEFMGRRVLVDDLGADNIIAALVDEDFFMVFDNMIQFTENYNGEGLYWNYFYHVWKTFSVSPFANAVIFTTTAAAPGVTSVTVSPTTPSGTKGSQIQFKADVVATNYAPKTVTWSVDSDKSYIDKTGLLTIGKDEDKDSLTVTATSTFDTAKTDSTTVSFS